MEIVGNGDMVLQSWPLGFMARWWISFELEFQKPNISCYFKESLYKVER